MKEKDSQNETALFRTNEKPKNKSVSTITRVSTNARDQILGKC